MRKGFTLIELSIVLAILGLLVGGIMGGTALIRSSQLQSIVSEFNRYRSAGFAFRDKYGALPGDIINATYYWGKDNTNCSGATGTVTTPGTCNGNGNSQIDQSTVESFLFWQHLAFAGMIEGNYTGIAGGGGAREHLAGTNSPKTKIDNGGWAIEWWGIYAGSATDFAIDAGNEFMIGTQKTASAPLDGLITPSEAFNIDTKLDDGKPGRGTVIARNWSTCTAATSLSDLDKTYLQTTSTNVCALAFVKMFDTLGGVNHQ